MAQQSKPKGKKLLALIPVVLVAGLAAVLLALGGFVYAANQETHDLFCASCHTQPELTFYQRSTAAQPVDLASYHTTQQTACINCHSGVGVTGRMQAELLGARNALMWYTGSAVQPAVLNFPISDQNCLKCHQDVTQRGFTPKEQITVPGGRGGEGGGEGEGRNNHWHQFLTRWQAASASAGTCVSCHASHSPGASPHSGFMNAQAVQEQCNACHQVLHRD